jgi:hypothetical protein
MKRVAQLLNDMLAADVLQNYALFGARAQMRYEARFCDGQVSGTLRKASAVAS